MSVTECNRKRAVAPRGAYDAIRVIAVAALLGVAGCRGPQSALDPAGRGAERIADLFWWLTAGGLVVWLIVIGLTFYVVRVRPGPHDRRRASVLIIGGGAVLPTLVLAGYLVYGLAMLPDLVAPAPEGSLKVAVSGEQWWWRVRYPTADGGALELANEIHLPVGEMVEFELESADVIHSFWVPSLAGKVDMFPGRVTRLAVLPTKTGVFHGVCAEFCGASHALMGFRVVVSDREEFDRWLARQTQVARPPSEPLARRGLTAFIANGCGACHTVRGTPAAGLVGPDLTHVGSRLSVGAGILPGEPDELMKWIAATGEVKPGVHMPAFRMLPPEDLRALANYLSELQ